MRMAREDVLRGLHVAELRRNGRDEGRVAQLGPVQARDRPQAAHRQRRLQRIDVFRLHLQVLRQQAHHRLGHLVIDREAHDRAELALAQPFLDRLQQVGRLVLLDFHVGVPDDLEAVALEHLVAGEEQAEVGADDLFEPDPAMLGDHGHEPGQRRRHLDAGKTLVARGAAHEHGQVEAEVRDVGEGPAGIERQRRDDGQHVVDEVLAQPVAFLLRQLRRSGTGRFPRPTAPAESRA